MSIEVNDTDCCAVDQIHNISHHKDPFNAMKAFCKAVCSLTGYYDYINNREKDGDFTPQNMYIFTGVIAQLENGKSPTYGQDFADFIVSNNLGDVTVGPARFNINNHPDHLVQVWIWSVNQENLKDWWSKNHGKRSQSKKDESVSGVSASGGGGVQGVSDPLPVGVGDAGTRSIYAEAGIDWAGLAREAVNLG